MATAERSTLTYGIEDAPPLPLAIGFGFQHVLTMFGATVAVPLILGPAMGLGGDDFATLFSAVLICSGIATILQITVGTRLPIIQGVSFSFLAPFGVIIAGTAGGEVTMQYIAGALIAGALVETALGYSGLIGKLRKWVSPVVIGPVIILIGLSLFRVAAGQAGLNWWFASYVVLAVFGFSLVLARKSAVSKMFPVLLAIVSAYLLALVLGWIGVIDEGSPAYIDFGFLGDQPWFKNPVDLVLPFGAPEFKMGFILSTMAGFLASMIEAFGQFHVAARVSGAPQPSAEQLSRGIGAKGLGGLVSGLFGGLGTTTYAENIGLVAITKVASRYAVMVGAVILIALGFVSKVGAVLATIPLPIIGGMYLVLFGLIAGIGLSATARADLTSERNLLIIGFSLFLGLSLPAYFETAVVEISSATWLADIITTVGSSGMAVAAISGLVLDNLIPGTDTERGLGAM